MVPVILTGMLKEFNARETYDREDGKLSFVELYFLEHMNNNVCK